jgi:hypothetical protein
MNINITGIYDNTVAVDSNLYDDVQLLQTGLSCSSDNIFTLVEGPPFNFSPLSDLMRGKDLEKSMG